MKPTMTKLQKLQKAWARQCNNWLRETAFEMTDKVIGAPTKPSEDEPGEDHGKP